MRGGGVEWCESIKRRKKKEDKVTSSKKHSYLKRQHPTVFQADGNIDRQYVGAGVPIASFLIPG